ncbi:DUF881 domain-containing protein [Clostridium gasigenes]|uniref:DUF881 domain-containing protein n=1 Tax=Clostridium gasigenes TaxID=94869 RepID=UPI001C0CB135|nr:DUF881 domain-containing protein [Clostridium gasigenes]MBU3102871.1 DUF881 domain-containing protein [Clostridium gasigenes]
MRKSTSQIVVAIVCALLGFLLAYQFKLLNKSEKNNLNQPNSDIISEIEGLKKQKEELVQNNTKILDELKKIEEAAAENGKVEGEIKKNLDNARMHLGVVDVIGPGIIITLKPKTDIFGGNANDTSKGISNIELVHIVNLMWSSRAEAISINDFRITPQTGIILSGNLIKIGSAGQQINPKEQIVIKVIGDKGKLNSGATFGGALDFGQLKIYNSDIKQSEDILINKTTQSLRTDFIKPVKE